MVMLRQGPPLPQAHRYICQHRPAASQSKNSNADASGCTQNTQMATGLRLCLLPNAGNPRRTIKRVAHGVSAAPDHLRALRASAYILVPRCHRSRDTGRDHRRSRSVAASSVSTLSPCRCLAGDSWQTARNFGVGSTEDTEISGSMSSVSPW